MNSNYSLEIPEKLESVPDFIIFNGNKKVGIEHTRLMNSESKMLIAETISILKKAEKILLGKDSQRTQLINISINYWKMILRDKSIVGQRFSLKEKDELAELIANYIECLLLNNEQAKPPFIDKVTISERSTNPLSIEINENYLGKPDYEDLITATLQPKEKRYSSYSQDQTLSELWLLIVLNGVTASSSYLLSGNIKRSFSSHFDKVFLFDGFSHESVLIYSRNTHVD